MKKQITMKKLIYLIFIPLLVGMGCSDDEKESNVLEGTKWKLVESKTIFAEHGSHDYTQYNIVYEFKINGTLVVSSNIDEYIGDKSGEYSYLFLEKTTETQYDILIINESFREYYIQENQLVIDNSSLDGPILYLNRINN